MTDGDSRLIGVFTFADLKEVAFDPSLDELVNARDIARLHPEVLTRDDNLEHALALMDVGGEDHIAVVDDLAERQIVGIVHHTDVLKALNRALMEAHAEAYDERRR